MKFYLLSDNVDTLVGMRLVGIDGVVIHERQKLIAKLTEVMKDETIGIVLITTNLVNMIPEIVSEFKLEQADTLIVEIPDRHGKSNVGQAINEYVSQAIGIKMWGDSFEYF